MRSLRRLRQRLFRWNTLLLLLACLTGLIIVLFLNYQDIGVISSREKLRLSSAPRVLSSSERTMHRGKPLVKDEISLDALRLNQAPYRIYTGIYITNNYDLNLKTPSYSSKGYIWMNWNPSFEQYLQEHNTTIEEVINLENDINSAGGTIQRIGDNVPTTLEDGSLIQSFTYSGQFYIDNLNLKRYPFNEINLPIKIEAKDPGDGLDYNRLRLTPNISESGIGRNSSLTGWLTQGWAIGEYRHHFATNLGISNSDEEYSQVIMDVSYGRSTWSAFWKLIQPLLVIMSAIILITKVVVEFRIEIPVAVLLSLVFLQEGYRGNLPDLAYLTFLDQIYVICYIAAFTSFATVLYLETRQRQIKLITDKEEARRSQVRLDRIQDIWPSASLITIILAVILCWLQTG